MTYSDKSNPTEALIHSEDVSPYKTGEILYEEGSEILITEDLLEMHKHKCIIAFKSMLEDGLIKSDLPGNKLIEIFSSYLK